MAYRVTKLTTSGLRQMGFNVQDCGDIVRIRRGRIVGGFKKVGRFDPVELNLVNCGDVELDMDNALRDVAKISGGINVAA